MSDPPSSSTTTPQRNDEALPSQVPEQDAVATTEIGTTINEKRPPQEQQQPSQQIQEHHHHQQTPTDVDLITEDFFPYITSARVPSSMVYSKATTVPGGGGSGADEEDGSVKASWRLKAIIVLCMFSLPVGCHYLEATIGTLKTALKKSMGINNTEFGILVSAVTLVNTILPLLAGFFIDDISSLGSIRGTSIVSVVIFVGSLLVSVGSMRNSYPIMIIGQVIYGLGGGMIVTMQEGILSRWFRDRELAIIIGLLLSIARLTKWAAKMACYPIVYAFGSTSAPIYVATLLCAAGVAMNGVYWFVMVRKGWATHTGKELVQPKQKYRNRVAGSVVVTGPTSTQARRFSNSIISQITGTVSAFRNTSRFKFSYTLFFHIPGIFWMVPWMQMIFSSVLSSFDDVATEFVEFRFNTTRIMAGYQSSLTQVVPIVVAPIMGMVLHRYGKRLTNLFVATLVLTVAMVLLAYTWEPPAAGMIVFSLALALGPVSLLTSTSMLLPHELAGTGMALHKCANNIGTTIVSVLVGYVQDLTYHDGNSADDHSDLQNEYNGVMAFYLILGSCSTLVVVIFWVMDRKMLNGWLEASKTERDRRLKAAKHEQEEEERACRYPYYSVAPDEQAEKRNKALQMIGSLLRPKRNYFYVAFYAFCMVVSWVIFFAFALMPVYQDYADVS